MTSQHIQDLTSFLGRLAITLALLTLVNISPTYQQKRDHLHGMLVGLIRYTEKRFPQSIGPPETIIRLIRVLFPSQNIVVKHSCFEISKGPRALRKLREACGMIFHYPGISSTSWCRVGAKKHLAGLFFPGMVSMMHELLKAMQICHSLAQLKLEAGPIFGEPVPVRNRKSNPMISV